MKISEQYFKLETSPVEDQPLQQKDKKGEGGKAKKSAKNSLKVR